MSLATSDHAHHVVSSEVFDHLRAELEIVARAESKLPCSVAAPRVNSLAFVDHCQSVHAATSNHRDSLGASAERLHQAVAELRSHHVLSLLESLGFVLEILGNESRDLLSFIWCLLLFLLACISIFLRLVPIFIVLSG